MRNWSIASIRHFRNACFALLLSVPALAQEEKLPPFYDVPSLPDSKPWLQWTIGIILILLCLMIAIRNPHRSHLD